MKQPKFKFGDKLEAKDGIVFNFFKAEYVITNSDRSGEYRYNGSYWESEVELYHQPQSKYLYGYRPRGSRNILYSLTEIPEDEIIIRCTGKDIEYPESK